MEDDDSIPKTIFVRDTTLLCRWEETGEENGMDDNANQSPSNGTPQDCVACAPPARPRRRQTLAPSAESQRLASLQSGVDLKAIRLLPVKCDVKNQGKAEVSPHLATPLSKVLELNNTSDDDSNTATTTAIFCIRRAGCASCRDHGMDLANLAQQHNVNLIGIVRKQDVDLGYVPEFYSDYFPFPLYQDDQLDVFKFLGNRKINFWQLLTAQPKTMLRYHQKKIKNIPFGGADIFTQGGILLFDANRKLRYVYYEQYGDELDVDSLSWAIKECQRQGK